MQPLIAAQGNLAPVSISGEEEIMNTKRKPHIEKTRAVIIILVLVFMGMNTSYASQEKLTGYQIIYNAEERYDGDTAVEESTMILINPKGQKRIRRYMRYRKDFGPAGKDEKSISSFLSPPDIKNTAYLTFEWDAEEKDDTSWLFLPALKKVKRLASSDKSDAFLGSDFTYTDLKSSKREFWDYTLIKESEAVDGHDCWVVEGIPKAGKKKKVLRETGYLKVQLWVRKDIFVKVKGKFWVKKGKRLKYYKASKIKKIDDIWTAGEMQMVTTKKGRVENTTILRIDKITYNRAIKDSFFTSQTLESGL